MGILDGYVILDCSIAMAGPLAAQRLADLGADVIKIEPITGEWQRHNSAGNAKGNRINVSFLSMNRNKRSLAVDLKSDEGKAILHELVKTADVFLQNYRAGVAERLGVDYDSLRAIKEDLIYVSISGYGDSGPYCNRPGQDLLLQAMSGAMYSTGRDTDRPAPAGQYLVDETTASTAFEGALAALLHRERTGQGQLVSINMLDAIVIHQIQEYSVYTVGKKPQTRSKEPHGHCYLAVPYGVFEVLDGYIALAQPDVSDLGELLNIPEFAGVSGDDISADQRDWVFSRTQEALISLSMVQCMTLLGDAGIWIAPVNTYEQVVNDPQIIHNGTFIEYDHPTEGHIKMPGFPIKFSETPSELRRGAPLIGENTRSILLGIGYDDNKITALLDAKIVAEDLV